VSIKLKWRLLVTPVRVTQMIATKNIIAGVEVRTLNSSVLDIYSAEFSH
jgi:hypothetical protein